MHTMFPSPGGRIFARQVRAQSHHRAPGRPIAPMNLLLGVVQLPATCKPEEFHFGVFLPKGLSMGEEPFKPLTKQDILGPWWRDELDHADIGSMFRSGLSLPKFLDPQMAVLFVRQTALVHENPALRWCYVAGAVPAGESSLPFKQGDGVYEFGSPQTPSAEARPSSALCPGWRLAVNKPFFGEAAGQVFREPIWGPGGRFGLVTSMELEAYSRFIEADRKRNARSDPEFSRFMEVLAQSGAELPQAYDAEQLARREEAARRAVAMVVAERDDDEPARPSMR